MNDQHVKAQNTAILDAVLIALDQAHTPQQSLDQALATVVRLTGWPGVFLLTPTDEVETHLVVKASAGDLVPSPDWRGDTVDGLMCQAWQTETHLYVPDLISVAAPKDVLFPQIVSLLMLPLVDQAGRRRGLFCVAAAEPEAFDERDRVLAMSLARALNLGLQNAQLKSTLRYELTERQRAEDRFWLALYKNETLYRIGRSLINTDQFEQTLETVMRKIAGALNTGRALLITFDLANQTIERFVAGGAKADQIPQLAYSQWMDSVIGETIREGEALLLSSDDVQALDDPVVNQCQATEPIGSVGIAPLSTRDHAFGVLLIANHVEQSDLSQQDLDLMMALAAQITAAIQNAQLFQAVRDERGRLQALVQSSRDGVILLGNDLRILVINRPAQRYLALPGRIEDWVNRPMQEALRRIRLFAPHVVKITIAELRRIQSGDDGPGEGEYRVGPRIIHWHDLPVRDTERMVGRLLVLQNVTEARLMEQFREDLTHTMVHDLRNPLTGIHAALKLLEQVARTALMSSHQQILDVAVNSTERMLKLVNAILDISRLESGRMPINATVFRLYDTVQEVLRLEQPLVEQKQITLVNDVSENLPLVNADLSLIERVLQNLIGNALKFTPEGGTVTVRATFEPEIPDQLRISVSDTGSGIPPEIRTQLFKKFVTGQQEGRGSGLGLAFCRMVLEAHNERIWVSSTSERGTTFTFTLPLTEK